jgi:protein O-GlcNAc transferase
MPNSYQINDGNRKIIKNELTKNEFGIPTDSFVFSSFNHTYKIEPRVFGVWMNILKKVPNSILWLLKSNDTAVKNLKNAAKKYNINPDRLIFAEKVNPEKHLSRIHLSDLCLDTFTCNGHTTTSDCLWAGVPVLTLKGKHFTSRVSASLLTAIGLPELITNNIVEYEKLAIYLATNPNKLHAIRTKIYANRITQPLFNTKLFVKNLETAYLKIWRLYKNGQKPEQVTI